MIFIKENSKSILAENYRNLRTSIEYSSADKKIKTIVITSSEASEGKSTVVTNLSYVLSQGGNKVIVIDCDLRKPKIHRQFQISNISGLTDYLTKKKKLDEVIKSLECGIDVITAGTIPPNPTDILDSKYMQETLESLGREYDYVIIDTPPIGFITDGLVLAKKCDGTILVVKSNYKKYRQILKGYNELVKIKANVIGTVLNGVEINERDSEYYNYG